MARQPIPIDHLIHPTEMTGSIGFTVPYGDSPPDEWQYQHDRAFWTQSHRGLELQPVVQLYVNGPSLNFELGWCVDA